MPITERYYGGGMASQRGFPQRALSPSLPSTDLTRLIAVGGAGLIEESIEARPARRAQGRRSRRGRVPRRRRRHVHRERARSANQHVAAGAGLRLLTPIGPIGVDVAYRLNRTGPGEPYAGHHWNALIAVGEAF